MFIENNNVFFCAVGVCSWYIQEIWYAYAINRREPNIL